MLANMTYAGFMLFVGLKFLAFADAQNDPLTVKGFNKFDWELSKAIVENIADKNTNLVVSPVSIKLVIGMLYLGATGKTAAEIETALDIKANETDKNKVHLQLAEILKHLETVQNEYELNIGTKIFIDNSTTLQAEYAGKLREFYNSTIDVVDFKQKIKTLATINAWSNMITKGHIQQLVTEDDTQETTIMLILNAIYFKGLWATPFPVSQTKVGLFTTTDGHQVEVPFMTVVNKFMYCFIPEMNSDVIRLPYVGNKFAMYIILPRNKNDISILANEANRKLLSDAQATMMKENNVKITLPKFSFESTLILAPALNKMGIRKLFEMNSDLMKIATPNNGYLTVSNVLQKAGLDVNEQGSVAFASTAAQVVSRFGEPITVEMNVNSPFIFLVFDEITGTIAFAGRVGNPLATGNPIVNIPVAAANTTSEVVPTNVVNRITPEEMDAHDIHDEERFNYFDVELLDIATSLNSGNIAVSPTSAKTTLSILLEGATGKAEQELIGVLRLPEEKAKRNSLLKKAQNSLKWNSNRVSPVKLDSNSRVFVSYAEMVSPKYKDTVKEMFSADIQKVNFALTDSATRLINGWASNATRGQISKLLDAGNLDPSTKLFLANCIYFKGQWLEEFDVKATRVGKFWTSETSHAPAYMMSARREIPCAKMLSLRCSAFELPFRDERYTFLVLLPDKVNGIADLLKDVQRKSIHEVMPQLKTQLVTLKMPRFTIESTVSLRKVLESDRIRGKVQDVFSETGSLNGILDNKLPLRVKDIIQKVRIEINEKGAKAAAATGVQVVMLSAPTSLDIVVDHPFLFYIMDKSSNSVIFEGLLLTPEQNFPAEAEKKIDNVQPHYYQSSPIFLPQNTPYKPPSYRPPFNAIVTRTQHGPQPSEATYQQPQPVDKEGVNFKENEKIAKNLARIGK